MKELTGNGMLSNLVTLIDIFDRIHDKFDGKRHKDKIKTGKGITIPISKTLVGKAYEGGFLQFLVPFLPYIFAGLGAAGTVMEGISAVVGAADTAKKNKAELEEMKRHNLAIESRGTGLKKTKKLLR